MKITPAYMNFWDNYSCRSGGPHVRPDFAVIIHIYAGAPVGGNGRHQ